MKRAYQQFQLYTAAILLLAVAACRKEYAQYPYTAIEQFTVNDLSGSAIKAVINEDNSIVLYWTPFEPVPDSIAPVIKVAEQAAILPASGTKVPLKDGTAYTVTAQNGTQVTYTLKLVTNTPTPEFTVAQTSFDQGDQFILNGKYIIPDTGKTKLYMVDENNKATQLTRITTFYSTTLHTTIPLTLAEGLYKIKLVSGSNTVIDEGPYQINAYGGNPYAGNTTYSFVCNEVGKTIPKGGDLTFTYTTSGGEVSEYTLSKLKLMIFTDGDPYFIDIGNLTNDTITFTLPSELNGGLLYFYIYVEKTNGEWEFLLANEGDPAVYLGN